MDREKFFPRRLPAIGTLADEVSQEPPGSIAVRAAEGGFVVQPRKYTLLFGRDPDEVHVAVGTDDTRVSRKHGTLTCDGTNWWLRNAGVLPIELPDGEMLLGDKDPGDNDHMRLMKPGYTPLIISSSRRRSHLVEVLIVASGTTSGGHYTIVETMPPQDIYELSPVDRLMLTALAQRYLRHEPYPQPVTYQQVADDLYHVDGKTRTDSAVEQRVSAIRKKLGIAGTSRDEVGEPIGTMLNHNLIRELLRTTTLMPQDLRLLDGA
ncbi:MAG TPA: hypothetical protein VFQ44_08910 [Streptosporangiaceae bacterium]|nr:hypothetical protein [Streptosporangiaceae bacterium]